MQTPINLADASLIILLIFIFCSLTCLRALLEEAGDYRFGELGLILS